MLPLRPLRAPTGRAAGFTLVEILAVITIMGSLAALGVPAAHEMLERARVVRAIGDIKAVSSYLDARDSLPDRLSDLGPVQLDPWGRPYQYNKFPPNKKVPKAARRDRFLVPINTSYDLYSMGRDGATSPALSAKKSQDDVIRANDGGFIGLASRY